MTLEFLFEILKGFCRICR